MDKFTKSQILKLSLILALLVVAPLLSSSLRSTYLYFVFNLLIIAIGAEAGLLSSSSSITADDVKPTSEVSTNKEGSPSTIIEILSPECTKKKAIKVVEKCSSAKIVGTLKVRKVKKCPSTPSLFFIGGGEVNDGEDGGEEEGGQELYNKAETFIGNFYKQLKMQREESWKRIHGFYHRAF